MRKLSSALVTLLFFGLATRIHNLLAPLLSGMRASWPYAAGGLVSALQVGVCLVALRLTRKLRVVEALRELGLTGSVVTGLGFGLLVTSPMLITFAATSPVSGDLTIAGVLFGSVVWPLAEEILYRGYAFGQLYQRSSWGFWPASLSIAGVFGVGHLYQIANGNLTVWGGVGVLLITAAGSVFFSWLFLRWSFNLWVPMAVHGLMNFWWEVFAVDQTALGGWVANGARMGTLVLAVGVSLRFTGNRMGFGSSTTATTEIPL